MLLGTAAWTEGPLERRSLVGRLASGRLADLNRIEAIRLRATRLAVVRRGRVIARSAPAVATLEVPGRPGRVDWRL